MGTTSVERRKISRPSTQAADSATGLGGGSTDVFRKFFESQFRPLDDIQVPKHDRTADVSDDDEESGEECFDGFSDNGDDNDDDSEEEQEVTVVEHVDVRTENVLLDKQTRKAILSAKVPASTDTVNSAIKKPNKSKDGDGDGDADNDEAANLQNDLALQRLLKESHLLDSTSSDLNPTGKNRHKALDLRLQALGAKKSIFERNKMPKSHRQGIEAKAVKTETTRRREARENGIILEKPVFKHQKNGGGSAKRRDRGVGAPAVGKFAGGTLRLSRHDLASIQGPSRKGGKGSKRGRR